MRDNQTGLWRLAALGAVLSIILPQLAVGQATVNGALSLVNLRITPAVLSAGGNVTISFQLYNSYNSNLNDVSLEMTAQNPLLNVSPVYLNYVTAIGTGQYGGLGYNAFNYTLHIPSTIQAGAYTVDVIATYSTVSGQGSLQTSEPGSATMPIYLYIYGRPQIQLTATPVGQITPGGQSTVTLTAINSGTDTARNVSVTVLNSPNFTAYGTSSMAFGIMASGSQASETAVLQTSPSLKQGSVSLPVRISYTAQSGQQVSIARYLQLNFVLGAPQITASISGTEPQQLYPGSNQTLTVLIQNAGYGTAKNLSVSLSGAGGINVQSSASSFYIGTLAAGGSATEQVLISASQSANLTNASLPVHISYGTLASGSPTSQVEEMPITLQHSSLFNITSMAGALVPGGAYQPVSFTVKNTGNEPAQQVSLVLQTVYPVSPTNPNFYINSLMPGQSANATFYVSVNSNAQQGTFPVTLYEQWRQPNGYTTQQYSGSNNYFVAVSAPGAAGWGVFTYAAIAVIILAAGAAAYRTYWSRPKPVGEKKKRGEGATR